MLAFADRQFEDPVCRQKVGGVVVRYGAVLAWIEAVQDEAKGCVDVDGVGFRIGTEVDRLRVGIAEVELDIVLHGVAQDELPGVVAAGANGRSDVERGVLQRPEASSLSTATGEAGDVQVVQSAGFVATIGPPYPRIDILC